MVKCDSVANVASSRVRKQKGRELRPFELVEIRGVEPLTFSMPLSPEWRTARNGQNFSGIFGTFEDISDPIFHHAPVCVVVLL